MQYFVVWPDGQKFGPADVSVLNQWATEGRINADTMLESVVDGSRVKAGEVPGIVLPVTSQASPSSEPEPTPQATPNEETTDPGTTAGSYADRYYVVGDGGHKYGPADKATLTQWASEGRLLPTSMLEHEISGQRETASQVQGIVFPVASAGASQDSSVQPSTPYGASTFSNYPRDGMTDPSAGQTEAIVSIILGVLGICCCCLLPIIGIFVGMSAQKKGNPLGKTAVIVNVVCFILSIIVGIVSVMTNPALLEIMRGG